MTRLQTYGIPVEAPSGPTWTPCSTTPPSVEWHEAAMKESWVVAHDEVDEPAIGPFALIAETDEDTAMNAPFRARPTR